MWPAIKSKVVTPRHTRDVDLISTSVMFVIVYEALEWLVMPTATQRNEMFPTLHLWLPRCADKVLATKCAKFGVLQGPWALA